MLTLIRKLVYKMGFRPRLYTVLHSPTLNMRIDAKKMLEGLERGLFLARTANNCLACDRWILKDGTWVRDNSGCTHRG